MRHAANTLCIRQMRRRSWTVDVWSKPGDRWRFWITALFGRPLRRIPSRQRKPRQWMTERTVVRSLAFVLFHTCIVSRAEERSALNTTFFIITCGSNFKHQVPLAAAGTDHGYGTVNVAYREVLKYGPDAFAVLGRILPIKSPQWGGG